MSESTLIGREAELRDALRALDEDPGSVVLHGPAGIGKTHLASAIVQAAKRRGREAHRVVATRGATSIPLGALAPVLPRFPDVVTDDRVNDLTLLQHAGDALARLGGRSDGRGGVVLVVDDAQYLDPTSALAVQQAASGRRLSVLLTVRADVPAPDAVEALWSNDDVHRFDLGPLTEDEVGGLLEAALDGPVEGATIHRLASLSQGNPLYALELAAAARGESLLDAADGVWRLDEGWRPSIGAGRLSDLLTGRIDALDDETREGLELISLAERLSVGEVERLVGPERLEALEVTGLVSVDEVGAGSEVRTDHPLIGELLRSSLPTGRRRRRYAQLADGLPGEAADSDEHRMRRALWLLDSGADEPEAFAWAARFARFASDFRTGLRFADAAYRSRPSVEVAVLAGEMAYQVGDYPVSDRWLGDAADLAVTDEDLALVVINHLSTVYWGLAEWDTCEQLVADFVDRWPDSPWSADLSGLLATLAMFSGAPNEGLERLAPLRRRTDLRAQVEVAFVEAGCLAMTGSTDRAVEVATEGFARHLELGEQLGLGHSGGHMLTSLAALCLGGRLDEAETMGSGLYAALVEAPNPFATVLVTFMLGRTALMRGRPITAERWFREGVTAARSNHGGDQLRWCLGGLALSLAMTGRVDEASDAAVEARSLDGLARLYDLELELAEAWLDAADRNPQSAVARLEKTADAWAELGFVMNEGRALQAALSLDAADRVADRLADLAEIVDSPLVALASRQANATLAHDVDDLVAVAHRLEEVGADLAAAEALIQAAHDAARSGDRRRATRLDHEAQDVLSRCEDVHPLLVFEEARLAPLTPREREVGLLAAQGLRSRDIAERLHVSVRTVDNHLHRAYVKLGLDDRSQLAAAFGLDDPSDT